MAEGGPFAMVGEGAAAITIRVRQTETRLVDAVWPTGRAEEEEVDRSPDAVFSRPLADLCPVCITDVSRHLSRLFANPLEVDHG
jgi:hypothetical protein